MKEIKNAKIKSVRLGSFERYWGAQICFAYGVSTQCVYFPMEKIPQLLKMLKLEFWESLPETPCRVKADVSHIFEIGHFIKDEWLEL